MPEKFQLRRLVLATAFLSLGFGGLGYRLVDLQVIRHESSLATVKATTQQTVLRQSRRGDIRDVRGNLLATSRLVRTVYANPSFIGGNQAILARVLTPILEMDESDLIERLRIRTWTNETGEIKIDQRVKLKSNVEEETWRAIQQAMRALSLAPSAKKQTKAEQNFYSNLRQRAIFVDPIEEDMRVYPHGRLAAHVLGFVRRIEKRSGKIDFTETVGVEGIERMFNESLSGLPGWNEVVVDRRQREIVERRGQEMEAQPGLNVRLTLDVRLQTIIETELSTALREHEPVSVSAVVVRPKTGEILAVATLPNFDPHAPGAVPADWRRNRSITDMAEPGSTFKIVVVAGALNDGLTTLQDSFDCEQGRFLYGGKWLHDTGRYGVLPVERIVSKSSNIGAAKIGIKLGQQRLHHYIRHFGFGEPTGVPLPSEAAGIVHPISRWNKLSISRIPMGHEVAATQLQMVMAMCAIANDGKLMRPMLVERIEDEQGRVVAQYQPQVVRQVLSPRIAAQMVEALKQVVSTNGTGVRAKLEHYEVAGKTGTAQKMAKWGPQRGKYYSSFIGFFPAENPELCIGVGFDEPKHGYYGGEVAAPVFQRISERSATYFSIRPSQVMASTVATHSDRIIVSDTNAKD